MTPSIVQCKQVQTHRFSRLPHSSSALHIAALAGLAVAALGGCKNAPTPPLAPATDVAATIPTTGQGDATGAATPPTATRAPRGTTLGCVAELIDGTVRAAAGDTPIRVDPDQDDVRRVKLAVWPGGDDAVLVAFFREWYTPGGPPSHGVLWRVPCSEPGKADAFVRREGADFAHAALSPDGWTLYFSDQRGVGALDLETREMSELTHPGTAWTGCWTPDAPLRDLVLSVSHDGQQVSFARGGPCGAEAVWVGRPWVLLAPLDAAGRQERPRHPIHALAAVPPATLWLSDGEGCDEPGVVAPNTRGAVWRSDDRGETWTRVEVKADPDVLGPYAEALLVDPRAPDRVVVHGATCRLAERGTIGGDVFASEDRGATWRRVWPGQAKRVTGLNDALDTLVVWVADGRRFASRDLGKSWLDLDQRPAPEATPVLPVHLGDVAFAVQDDGLYRRAGLGTPPTRVFPPATAP